jgi:hypothetical protein
MRGPGDQPTTSEMVVAVDEDYSCVSSIDLLTDVSRDWGPEGVKERVPQRSFTAQL